MPLQVLYRLLDEEDTVTQEATVLGADTYSTHVTQLKKYRRYQLQVRAYTRVGDGVLSPTPVVIRTHEDGKSTL